jgi:hypothetical protein
LLLAAAWAFLVCGALTLASARARGADARELSTEEEADLRAGKLVVRPTERELHGRQLIGGMSWQLINADVEQVYSALTDVNAHVKYLPAAEEVRLIAPGPPQLLFVQHRLGPIRASYFVHKTTDPARHSMLIRMDHSRPSALRDAWAEVRVHPYGAHASIVSLVVMADLGEGLIVGVIRSNVHTWMLRVPMLLKRYIEARTASPR